MMKDATVSARVQSDIKAEAEEILKNLGIAAMIAAEFSRRAFAIASRASSLREPAFIRKRDAFLAAAPIISS